MADPSMPAMFFENARGKSRKAGFRADDMSVGLTVQYFLWLIRTVRAGNREELLVHASTIPRNEDARNEARMRS